MTRHVSLPLKRNAGCRPEDTLAILPAADVDAAVAEPLATAVCPAVAALTTALFPSSEIDTATDGDLHIFITARPTPAAAPGASTVCHRSAFGRPIIAHINVHAPLLSQLHGNALRGIGRPVRVMRATLRHEVMHALALTWNSLLQFRDRSRMLQVCSAHLPRPVNCSYAQHAAVSALHSTDECPAARSDLTIAHRAPVAQEGLAVQGDVITERLVANGGTSNFLVTPRALFALRSLFSTDPFALQNTREVPGLEISTPADGATAADVRTCLSHCCR